MKSRLSIEARIRYLAVPSAAACAIMVLALFVVSRIASLLSPLAFGLLSALVVAGFAVEMIHWRARGIRRVDLGPETLTIQSGRGLSLRSVDRRSVARLKLTYRLGRHGATLFLGSGKRLRIRGDAFSEEAFSRLVAALKEWAT